MPADAPVNRNSALLWFPAIEAAGLPVPRTAMIHYDHAATLGIFDGEKSPEFDRLRDAVETAVRQIGAPAFIRSDLGSAKHSGPGAYRVEKPESCARQLADTIEDNEMKFWLEPPGPQAIMVREFLDLDAPFTAFRGLPIAREWRFFADAERIRCWHPYWPADALEGHVHDVPNWRGKLAESHALSAEDFAALDRMAVRAARACGGGEWSVDFALDRGGKYWLIDMAVAADSYHWPGCPNESGAA